MSKLETIHKERSIKSSMQDIAYMATAVTLAGCGLESFLLPAGLIDGGVTGVSLLINNLSGIDISILIILINIPFIILGVKLVGTRFAVRSLVAIAALAGVLWFFQYPVFTTDKVLVAVFGGFFLGAGIGMAVRGGAVIDGTEILALFISRNTGLTIGNFILIINIFIFCIAALVLNIEVALYSILTYFSASKTVDFIIHGIEEYTGVTIVSEKSEEIRNVIIDKIGRGVTIYKAKRGYGTHGDRSGDIDVIFTVITRLEIARVKNEVKQIDEHAFIVLHTINETRGGMVKKRRLHS